MLRRGWILLSLKKEVNFSKPLRNTLNKDSFYLALRQGLEIKGIPSHQANLISQLIRFKDIDASKPGQGKTWFQLKDYLIKEICAALQRVFLLPCHINFVTFCLGINLKGFFNLSN